MLDSNWSPTQSSRTEHFWFGSGSYLTPTQLELPAGSKVFSMDLSWSAYGLGLGPQSWSEFEIWSGRCQACASLTCLFCSPTDLLLLVCFVSIILFTQDVDCHHDLIAHTMGLRLEYQHSFPWWWLFDDHL